MWYLFALLSACISSLRKVGEKQLSHNIHYLTMGWAMQLFSLPITLLAVCFIGQWFNPFTLGLQFWAPTVLMWAVVYPLFFYCYMYAIKHGELSKVLPLQSLTPILVLIFARVFINQVPSQLAVFGIILVVSGVYVLNLKGRYLHNPLKIFSNDKPNLYMLLSLVLTSVAGVLDNIAIQASEASFYSLVGTVIAVIAFLVLSKIKGINEFAEVKKYMKPLSISGTFSGMSYLLYAIALTTGPLAYVSTIKSTSVLMGTMLGVLYFKERLTKAKIASLLLISIGVVLLGLSS